VTDWEPDYSLDAPEGHLWVKPAPEDCPDCSCCTARLCATAAEKELPCWWVITNGGQGVEDVRNCPCGQKIEDRMYAQGYLDASPEVRAEYEQDLAPDLFARIKQLAAELEKGATS
jgi:hypothetical protein